MTFRLADTGWDRELSHALGRGCEQVQFICPFIKEGTVRRLLGECDAGSIRVLTRFNLCDFNEGVSDIAALEFLLKRGAKIRGIRNLHAKLYMFDSARVIVTSANLTDAGLSRNHEIGFVTDDVGIVSNCRQYFENLWRRTKNDLRKEQLEAWQEIISAYRACGEPPKRVTALKDLGADLGMLSETDTQAESQRVTVQAFVKFFGKGGDRSPRTTRIIDEIESSESHFACTYPRDKRPRNVKDGATMYMARLVKDPNDILIYGRAEGMRYIPGRDDATAADVKRKPWKEDWPHYIRVRHPEFIDGALNDGVSIADLKHQLGSDAFATTQRNEKRGYGNTDPNRAYLRQPAVELSPEGIAWVEDHLNEQFTRQGKLDRARLDTADLYWPSSE